MRNGIIINSIFFLLNLFDIIISYYLISGGYGYEANPCMAWIITNLGWFWTFVIKISIGVFAAGIFLFYWKKERSARIVSVIALSVYALLAIYLTIVALIAA